MSTSERVNSLENGAGLNSNTDLLSEPCTFGNLKKWLQSEESTGLGDGDVTVDVHFTQVH